MSFLCESQIDCVRSCREVKLTSKMFEKGVESGLDRPARQHQPSREVRRSTEKSVAAPRGSVNPRAVQGTECTMHVCRCVVSQGPLFMAQASQ